MILMAREKPLNMDLLKVPQWEIGSESIETIMITMQEPLMHQQDPIFIDTVAHVIRTQSSGLSELW